DRAALTGRQGGAVAGGGEGAGAVDGGAADVQGQAAVVADVNGQLLGFVQVQRTEFQSVGAQGDVGRRYFDGGTAGQADLNGRLVAVVGVDHQGGALDAFAAGVIGHVDHAALATGQDGAVAGGREGAGARTGNADAGDIQV